MLQKKATKLCVPTEIMNLRRIWLVRKGCTDEIIESKMVNTQIVPKGCRTNLISTTNLMKLYQQSC